MSLGDIPSYLVRPLIILVVVGWWFWFYLYSTWSFTEEKLVEKIAQHRDEPLSDIRAPRSKDISSLQEIKKSIQEKEEELRPVSSPLGVKQEDFSWKV